MFLLCFLAVSWDGINFGGDVGKIKQNASSVLFNIAGTISLIPGMFLASAIMGVPILRDFEHKMESLIFTTNITKTTYLAGRFIGSFLILLFISTGFIWGTWLGCMMPWVDHTRYLSVAIGQYAWPWFVLIAFNMFMFSCVFFAVGALTRKMLFIYLQTIVLLAIYIAVDTLVGDVENLKKAAILDPFGYYSVRAVTRYWTVAEKNTLTLSFSGLVLLNRMLWAGVGLIFLAVTFVAFKFRSVYTGLFKKRVFQKENVAIADTTPIPFSKPLYNAATWFKQVTVLTRLYFKEIFRSIPFIGIGIVGVILIGVDASYASTWYGQELYPLSSMIADFVADEIGFVISVMILFYSGELIWKEKEIRFSQIFDTMPTSYAVPVVSKYLALAGIILVYLLALIPVGIIIQLVKGFNVIELSVYLKVILLRVYLPMLVYIAMAVFVQSVSGNKFV
ncbi:MAG: hypothetical protein V4581_04880, partial [Bacteroidota bacterium]